MNNVDPSVAYASAQSAREAAQGTQTTIRLVGNLLGIIFGVAGVLNLINTLVTTILIRRHEFATMQSIGMTRRQLRSMLVHEGLFYALGGRLLGLVFSVVLAFTLVQGLTSAIWYFTFHFTLCLPWSPAWCFWWWQPWFPCGPYDSSTGAVSLSSFGSPNEKKEEPNHDKRHHPAGQGPEKVLRQGGRPWSAPWTGWTWPSSGASSLPSSAPPGGKSTLLNMLGGLDTPTEGEHPGGRHRSDPAHRGAGHHLPPEEDRLRLPELQPHPCPHGVGEHRLPLTLDGQKPDRAFIMEVVRLLGLERKLDSLPGNLSGGQQQRVAIARALASKPAILLADEPTGNLDSKTSEDVIALLKTTSQTFHQTIVMITHNPEIAQLADRVVRIEDGKILAS